MKKALLVLLMVLVGVGASLAFADRGEDFKVIQGGVKADKSGGAPTVFRIQVSEKGQKKVDIRLPLSLAESLASCAGDKIQAHKSCDIDLQKVLAELKKGGPSVLIEITDNEDTVKIWVE